MEDDRFIPFFSSGAIYLCGRCKTHQPILVMKVKKFIEVATDLEYVKCAASYFADFIIKHMFVQGRIENWMTLVDMSDVGIAQIPMKQLQAFMSHLQSNYRGRMYRTIIVFSPILLRALWNIIWAWIDEFVQ